MKTMVVGFAFDKQGNVALIHKDRPAWMAGKWNGIGGKVEEGECPAYAMPREFAEETGMVTSADDWRCCARIYRNNGYDVRDGDFEVFVFTATFETLKVKTMESEPVLVFGLPLMDSLPTINHVRALIEIARMSPGHDGDSPIVSIEYK